MDITPFIIIGIALSAKLAILAGLGILTLLALLTAILVVWFGYGVAHTGKDSTTDLAVLAGTVTPAYLGVFCIWRSPSYLVLDSN